MDGSMDAAEGVRLLDNVLSSISFENMTKAVPMIEEMKDFYKTITGGGEEAGGAYQSAFDDLEKMAKAQAIQKYI